MHANGEKIAVLTCYDAAFARVLDRAGVDCLLVGDSLGNVLQGRPTTLPVTVEEMSYHNRLRCARQRQRLDRGRSAVRQLPRVARARDAARRRADAARCAHGQARGRRLDGSHRQIPGRSRRAGVRAPGIHAAVGACARGYRVQGRDEAAARTLRCHAEELASAGAALLVLRARARGAGARPHRHAVNTDDRNRRRRRLLGPGARAPRHARSRRF